MRSPPVKPVKSPVQWCTYLMEEGGPGNQKTRKSEKPPPTTTVPPFVLDLVILTGYTTLPDSCWMMPSHTDCFGAPRVLRQKDLVRKKREKKKKKIKKENRKRKRKKKIGKKKKIEKQQEVPSRCIVYTMHCNIQITLSLSLTI